MKLRALKEFNHGSLEQHYLPGMVFTISDGDGADLVKAGLAELLLTPAPAVENPAKPEGRETKPAPAATVLTTKTK